MLKFILQLADAEMEMLDHIDEIKFEDEVEPDNGRNELEQ